MKSVFYFLALLALMWSAATEAQYDEARDFFQAQEEFDSWVKECADATDTMTIEEALCFRVQLGGSAAYNDFVITKTESIYGPDFRQGIYWPDGIVVDLPRNANPELSRVILRGKGDLALSFVTNDANGGYSIFTISLPVLPSLKVKAPCNVAIKVLSK